MSADDFELRIFSHGLTAVLGRVFSQTSAGVLDPVSIDR